MKAIHGQGGTMKPRLRLTILVGLSTALLAVSSSASLSVSGGGASAATATTTDTFQGDTVLVGFQVGTTLAQEQAIVLAVGATETDVIGADTHVLRVAPGTVLATIALLTTYPEVRYAEPDYDVQADQSPSDPMYNQLWGMPDIQADHAWDGQRRRGRRRHRCRLHPPGSRSEHLDERRHGQPLPRGDARLQRPAQELRPDGRPQPRHARLRHNRRGREQQPRRRRRELDHAHHGPQVPQRQWLRHRERGSRRDRLGPQGEGGRGEPPRAQQLL